MLKIVVQSLVFTTQNQDLEEEWEWKQKRNKCDFGNRLCLTEQIFSMPY